MHLPRSRRWLVGVFAVATVILDSVTLAISEDHLHMYCLGFLQSSSCKCLILAVHLEAQRKGALPYPSMLGDSPACHVLWHGLLMQLPSNSECGSRDSTSCERPGSIPTRQ